MGDTQSTVLVLRHFKYKKNLIDKLEMEHMDFIDGRKMIYTDIETQHKFMSPHFAILPMSVSSLHIDGLVQDCSISIANALEILQSCTNLMIYLLYLQI